MEEFHDDFDLEVANRLQDEGELNRAARKKTIQDRALAAEATALAETKATDDRKKAAGDTSRSDELSKDAEIDPEAPDEQEGDLDETSIFGDIFAGLGAGVRDDLVNTAQFGLDLVTFGQTDINLDSLLPDVKDRDSTTFGLVKGASQFLTTFVPVFGVMGKMAKAKRLAKAVKGGMEYKTAAKLAKQGFLNESKLGLIGREMTAGAVADLVAFSPQEERLSNLLQDQEFIDKTGLDFSNPITEYLASNEDDGVFEGRLKNVLEGAGLGILFDSIFRGTKALYQHRSAHSRSLLSDATTEQTDLIFDSHQQSDLLRQQADELDAVIDEFDLNRAAASPGDPASVGVRAGTDEGAATRADSMDQTADEFADGMDARANADSDFGQLQQLDPARAAKITEAGDLARTRLTEERLTLGKELAAAERQLALVRNSGPYKRLPANVRKTYEKTDELMTPKVKEEVQPIHDRVADETVPTETARPRDEKAAEALEADRVLTGEDADIFTANGDIDPQKLADVLRRNHPKESGPVVTPETTLFDTTKNAMVGVMGKAEGNINAVDPHQFGQVRGLNNWNHTHVGGTEFNRIQGDETATIVAEHTQFKSMTLQEQADAAILQAEATVRELGLSTDPAALLEARRHSARAKTHGLAVDLLELRILGESNRTVARAARDELLNNDGLSVPSILKFYNALYEQTAMQEALGESTAGLAQALGSYRIMVDELPSFATVIEMKQAGEGGEAIAKRLKEMIDAAGGVEKIKEQIIDMGPHLDNPLDFNAYVAKTERPGGFLRVALEAWMGLGLLTGPTTHIVNVTSNNTVHLYSHAETFGAGLVRAVIHGEGTGLRMTFKGLEGMVEGWKSLLKFTADPEGKYKRAIAARVSADADADRLTQEALDALGPDINPLQYTGLTGQSKTVAGGQKFDINHGMGKEFSHQGINRALDAHRWGSQVGRLKAGTTSARFVDIIGNMVGASYRALGIEDEQAKFIGYSSARKKNAVNHVETVEKFTGEEAAARVDEIVGRVTNRADLLRTGQIDKKEYMLLEGLHQKNLDEARTLSWTKELDPTSLSGKYNEATKDHPALKIFTPFVRTAVNLFRYGSTRTPLVQRFTQEFKALDMKVKKARKLGQPDVLAERELEAHHVRTAMMTANLTIGGTLAYQGIITGQGPSDPGERRALLATGWAPYSVRFLQADGSHEYFSYNRLDPMGQFLGMVATWGDIAGHIEGKELEELGMQFGAAVINSMKSKTYLSGLTAAVGAFAEPEQHAERWFQQLGSSIVPAAVTQTNRMGIIAGHLFPGVKNDPMMREVEGVLDAIRSKLPGFSADLAPKRNWFGEVITWAPFLGQNTTSPFHLPIARSTGGKTKVDREIERLVLDANFKVSMNGYEAIDGVQLDPHQRDRYITLTTTDPNRNGNDFRTQLAKLMQSRKYKIADDGIEGKQKLIKQLIYRRKVKARRRMLKDDKELAGSVADTKRLRRMASRKEGSKQGAQSQSADLLASLNQTPDTLS
jgi:hypothetical protein